jgi:hypothetical protein
MTEIDRGAAAKGAASDLASTGSGLPAPSILPGFPHDLSGFYRSHPGG